MTGTHYPEFPAPTGDWVADAACAEVDGDLWFPEEKGSHSPEAKRICRACAAVPECLTYAIDNNITDGIWGGMTARGRRNMRQAQRRRTA